MTRINSAIPVRNLTDEHLLAEHREIKRLPYFLQKSVSCETIRNIPKEFTLGKGHVTFFLDKQRFLYERYKEIYNECLRRGFNVTNYEENWNTIPEQYFNIYVPTNKEHCLIVGRISERISNSKKETYHYCGKRIGKMEALQLLKI